MKQATPAKSKAPQLPKGFQPIKGDFGTKWDYEANPILEGTVTRMDRVEVGKGKNRRESGVMDVTTKDGSVVTVWESAALRGLFQTVSPGFKVYLAYLGEKKIAGQKNPMRDFSVGFVPGKVIAKRSR